MPKMTAEERKAILRAMGLMSQIAFTFVSCVVIGIFLGRFLDDLLGTPPLFLVILTLLGCATSFKTILDLAKKFMK